nr:RecName: Full=Uncharacterized protein SMPP15 [Nautilus macromphalus]
LGICFASMPR